MVIMKNADGEGELRRQERKHERLMEKCKIYEEGLEASLAEERKVRRGFPSPLSSLHRLTVFPFPRRQRVGQFERFILTHLLSQTDVLSGRRRSSVMPSLPHSASVAGFVPLMSENMDLAAISPEYVELDDLPVRLPPSLSSHLIWADVPTTCSSRPPPRTPSSAPARRCLDAEQPVSRRGGGWKIGTFSRAPKQCRIAFIVVSSEPPMLSFEGGNRNRGRRKKKKVRDKKRTRRETTETT